MFFQVNSLLALEQHPHHHPHPVIWGFICIYRHTHTQDSFEIPNIRKIYGNLKNHDNFITSRSVTRL